MTDPMLIVTVVLGLPSGLLLFFGCGLLLRSWVCRSQ